MEWQLQDAKAKFSELVQKAIDDGAQTVTRRGRRVAVLLSSDEYDRLMRSQIDFKEFLSLAPLEGVDLERPQEPGRRVDL